MTGTGTQTDPYIVMNADELVEATSTSEGGNTRYVKLGADINVDGRSNVNMYFYELDGDGHSIININVQDGHGLILWADNHHATIKNVSFMACSAKSQGGIIQCRAIGTNKQIKFYKCNFSVQNTNRAMIIDLSGGSSNNYVNIVLDSCVVDSTYESSSGVELLIGSTGVYGFATYSYCHINIDANVANKTKNAHMFSTGSGDRYFDHCYFTGKFKFTTSTNSGTAGSSIFYGKLNTCYAAIQGENVSSFPVTGGVAQGGTFYDSDIYSGGGIGKALTTEQCKDITYLNSIGFDVVPGE